jgi:site-specific recombinase XerD
MLVSEAVSEFLAVRRVKLAAYSLAQYTRVLDGFWEFCGAVDCTSLRASNVASWVEWMQSPRPDGTKLASKSVVSYFKIVHAFLTWLVKEDEAPARVLHVEAPRLEQKIPGVFGGGEVLSLVKASSKSAGVGLRARDAALLLLLADTGLRASELGGLTLDRLRLDEGYVIVRGKGSKWREVGPLSPRTVRAVKTWLSQRQRYKPQTDAVFVTRLGTAINRNTLDALLRRLRDKAGMEGTKVGAHKFRHSWARSQALAGADVLSISRLMGHVSVGITQSYLGRFSSADARRMVGSVVDSL